MKNQYFGDRRDYFKYDLVLHLLNELESAKQASFLVMLTESDASRDGSLTSYQPAGRSNALYDHLQQALASDNRNVGAISPFFDDQGFACQVYDQPFSHHQRARFFATVASDHLHQAVILLDPDNGFEVLSMTPASAHKYVTFAEVRSLYSRMSPDSVLLVYQHIPRVQRKQYFAGLSARIADEITPVGCAAVTDNQIAFIALTKSPGRALEVDAALSVYAEATAHEVLRL